MVEGNKHGISVGGCCQQVLLEQLQGLGYAIASDELIGPDDKQSERESQDAIRGFRDVVIAVRVRCAGVCDGNPNSAGPTNWSKRRLSSA